MRKTLTFGFSTLSNRVGNITFPPLRADREVLVIIQNPEDRAWTGKDLSEIAMREDVEIVELTSLGVAKSRNAAIDRAQGKYLIFSDDDIQFVEQGLEEAIEYLEQHPKIDLVLGAAINEKGEKRKRYPSEIGPLTKFNSAKAATYEMLIRVDAIRNKGIRFDENFGAGATNYLGDEFIFIADLIDAGGKGVSHPAVLAIHPEESSGSRWGSARDFNARLAIFDRVFGKGAFLIRLGFALRRTKELGSIANAIRFAIGKPRDL
jgi:glycosyltransferase involved in cell wall biosynthesis